VEKDDQFLKASMKEKKGEGGREGGGGRGKEDPRTFSAFAHIVDEVFGHLAQSPPLLPVVDNYTCSSGSRSRRRRRSRSRSRRRGRSRSGKGGGEGGRKGKQKVDVSMSKRYRMADG